MCIFIHFKLLIKNNKFLKEGGESTIKKFFIFMKNF